MNLLSQLRVRNKYNARAIQVPGCVSRTDIFLYKYENGEIPKTIINKEQGRTKGGYLGHSLQVQQ